MTKLLDSPTGASVVSDPDETAGPPRRRPAAGGAATGKLVGFTSAGEPLVRVAARGEQLVARTTVALSEGDIGHKLALIFEDADIRLPIVLGILRAPIPDRQSSVDDPPLSCELQIDRDSIQFRARRQIVLRCGAASVTLKSDGRIILRGTDILSRSTGLNRLKGGAVEIN